MRETGRGHFHRLYVVMLGSRYFNGLNRAKNLTFACTLRGAWTTREEQAANDLAAALRQLRPGFVRVCVLNNYSALQLISRN